MYENSALPKLRFSIDGLMLAAAIVAEVLIVLKRYGVTWTDIAVLGPMIASPAVVTALWAGWFATLRVHVVLWPAGVVGWYTTCECMPLANAVFAVTAGVAVLALFDSACSWAKPMFGPDDATAA